MDPAAGAAKAAQLLRPAGRLALFGHVFEPPPEVAEAFAVAYRRVVPDPPFNRQPARRPLHVCQAMYATFADGYGQLTSFGRGRANTVRGMVITRSRVSRWFRRRG